MLLHFDKNVLYLASL